jgi:hypothetical protein
MASEKPQSPKDGDILTSRLRAEAKLHLEKYAPVPPPFEPGKPETTLSRTELIEILHLRNQHEERMDNIIELIKEGDPVPSYEAILKTFSIEQLALAATFQEPTLLIIPKTSFEAKVAALDAIVATVKRRTALSVGEGVSVSEESRERAEKVGKWKDSTFANYEMFYDGDSGSEVISGWKALIVDGVKEMDPMKIGDDVELRIGERIENRKKFRKPGEMGMDHHAFSMLVLVTFLKAEPIDEKFWSLLDDGPAIKECSVILSDGLPFVVFHAPRANWNPITRQVVFTWIDSDNINGYARFFRSVGGDVKP